MKKNSTKTRIIGTALAAVCAVSTLAAVSAVSVGAASAPETNSVSAKMNAARGCTFRMDGDNWTYWLKDNTNVDIDANINFSTDKVTFFINGLEPGVVNAVLKTERPDGRWNNVPIRFVVDINLNVNGTQTGRLFVTDTADEG